MTLSNLIGRLRRESDQGIVELYVDQIVRRVDPQQRNLRTFFQQEFAKPFGKRDLHLYHCSRQCAPICIAYALTISTKHLAPIGDPFIYVVKHSASAKMANL